MKKEIVDIVTTISENVVSSTGSWVIYGEKEIPKEMLDEYRTSEKYSE